MTAATVPSYMERVLADSADRESWLAARGGRVGASDAAKYSKLESAAKYADAKEKPSTFTGSATTENGNRWEPMLLSYVGIPQNTLLFHHPDNERFVATPDGLRALPSLPEPWEDGLGSTVELAEIKTKHNKIVTGPTPAELRQVAWQLFVLPEAEAVEWVWGEVVGGGTDWELREGSPKRITFSRTDPQIIAIQNQIVPIATSVLAELARRNTMRERAGF